MAQPIAPGFFKHGEGWYMKRFGVGEAEREDMISSLLRNLSTLNMQQQNRISDATAFLPEGSQIAAGRAADYQNLMAGQEGITGVNRYVSEANRQAWRDIANMFLEKQNIEAQKPSTGEQILGYLGAIGQGVGVYAAASDIRLKTNIRLLGKTNRGNNIYLYNWKDTGAIGIGVLAQEVALNMPDAVMINPDTGYLMVDYNKV